MQLFKLCKFCKASVNFTNTGNKQINLNLQYCRAIATGYPIKEREKNLEGTICTFDSYKNV